MVQIISNKLGTVVIVKVSLVESQSASVKLPSDDLDERICYNPSYVGLGSTTWHTAPSLQLKYFLIADTNWFEVRVDQSSLGS